MNVSSTGVDGVLRLEPAVFGDARGFFFESFNQREFDERVGPGHRFVQDNHSRSKRGVLRGLHYQVRQQQAKLVRAISGAVFDVAVDLRRASPTFGRWTGAELSEDNRAQMWIPAGCAHGFLVLSDSAEVLYKCTDYYAPQHERCLAWNDPQLAIEWPLDSLGGPPLLSEKDRGGTVFSSAEMFP